MITAIEQRHFHIEHGISGERAVLGRLFDPLLNRGYVFTRNRAAFNGIDKFKPNARFLRLKSNPDTPILAAAAGLPHKPALLLNLFPDSLFVRDLRLAHVGADV